MDTVTKKNRSHIMSQIKCRDSKIETTFRRALWRKGFRYRKNSARYFGKPDIVLRKYKTVIFVDSCFWHGCKKHCRMPSTNIDYWSTKIEKNRKRDKKVTRYYRKAGWHVIRVWEHKIKKDINRAVSDVIRSCAVRKMNHKLPT